MVFDTAIVDLNKHPLKERYFSVWLKLNQTTCLNTHLRLLSTHHRYKQREELASYLSVGSIVAV